MDPYLEVNGIKYLHIDACHRLGKEAHATLTKALKPGDLVCYSELSGFALILLKLTGMDENGGLICERIGDKTFLKEAERVYSVANDPQFGHI